MRHRWLLAQVRYLVDPGVAVGISHAPALDEKQATLDGNRSHLLWATSKSGASMTPPNLGTQWGPNQICATSPPSKPAHFQPLRSAPCGTRTRPTGLKVRRSTR